MHEFKSQKRSPFYGEWMPTEVDARLDDGQMRAPAQDVARMRDILADQIDAVQMMKDTRVWSHGDFHSENMMLSPGMTCVIDLTEARMKLAIYDIVDFLKVDIYREGTGETIDRSGMIASHHEMFFRGYKHSIKPELFDVAMRGRLLIDWASITQQAYFEDRDSQRKQFARLKERLDIAFGS